MAQPIVLLGQQVALGQHHIALGQRHIALGGHTAQQAAQSGRGSVRAITMASL
jgi:hypothetical protein